MLIVNLLGHNGVGKNTVAGMLQKELTHAKVKSLATPVKEIVALMHNKTVEWVDSHKDNTNPSGISVREQLIGVSDLGFDIHPDFWWRLPTFEGLSIYTDVRHSSWLRYTKDIPTVNIIIRREGFHLGGIPKTKKPIFIYNNGNLSDLVDEVRHTVNLNSSLKFSGYPL